MSHRTIRRLTVTVLAVTVWLAVGASTALAKVGPDDPAQPTPSRTVTVTTVDWNQLALTAAVACLIGIAATVAVQLVVRRSHRASIAHA
jgi:hypothetical protein